MSNMYDMIVDARGTLRYRKDKKYVGKDAIPEAALDVLTIDNIVNENGLIIVDNKKDEEKQPSTDEPLKLQRKDDSEDESPEDDGELADEDLHDEPEEDDDDVEDDRENEPEENEPEESPKETTTTLDKAPEARTTQAPRPARRKKTARDAPRLVSQVPQSKQGMGFPRVNGYTVDVFDGETPYTHLKTIGGIPVPLSAQNFKERTDFEIIERLKEMGKTPIDFNKIQQSEAAFDTGDDDEDLTDDSV